jgi:hypothetical protein
MWSLISQGKSSSFIGLPWDLFVEESRKSAFKSGEQWEVLRREEGAVIAGKEGVEKQLPPDQTWKFSVFEQQKVTLSIGQSVTGSDSRKTQRSRTQVPQRRAPNHDRYRGRQDHIRQGRDHEIIRNGVALHID